MTDIVPLEADQGRLTAAGQPEDSDDPYNLQPRATDPAAMPAGSFATLLGADGIHVTGTPQPQTAPANAAQLASVASLPVAAMVAQMLQESNNVIAENLARQVALATGQPASFSGAAAAVTNELGRPASPAISTWWTAVGCHPMTPSRPDPAQVLELAVARPSLRPLLAPLPVAGFPALCRPARACSAGSAPRRWAGPVPDRQPGYRGLTGRAGRPESMELNEASRQRNSTYCSASTSGETALSRTGWAASTNSNASGGDVPANALDGNLTTRFSTDEAQASGLYFQVALGSPQGFNEVDMEVPNSAGDYPRGFTVGVSNSSTGPFTTVATCTGTSSSTVVSFAAQSASFVRVTLNTAYAASWWSIDEFYLDTTGGGTTTTTRPTTTTSTTASTTTTTTTTGTNCSATDAGAELGRAAWVASTNTPAAGGDVASNAIDGNLNTRFSSDEAQAAGEYWEANMGSAQTFNELDMEVPNSAGDYARGYSVEVSTNGTTWTTVATCTGSGPSEVVTFGLQTAQYLRVVLTTALASNWWSIDELYLYNTTVTPTPCGSTSGNAPWPNYGGNLAHSNLGVNVTGTPTTLSQAWMAGVDGAVYGQSLLAGGCLYVGTENDTVYAIDAANGLVVWHVHLATPVTSGLPCGDISPSGITGTPAIDPATGVLWVVINTDVSGSPAHELVSMNSTNGNVLSTQVLAVPGTDPTAQGVRSAVDVANGDVYVTFGGLYGDCGSYLGAVAAVPETGGSPTWYKVPTSNQAGMWEPGGPDILSNGDLLVADGNGAAGPGQPFDGGDAVIELTPNLSSAQYFAPSNWATLNSTDEDLGDTAPSVLPGNLGFQVGKNGTGYLFSTTTLGGVGGELYSAQICDTTDDANYGGSAVSGDIVYVPCSDGITAVSVSGNSFSILWHSSGGGLGSIVLAGGDLFEQVQNGTLYEINASNGAVLQSLSLAAPGAHWPSLIVVGSTLYVENGGNMEAFSGV